MEFPGQNRINANAVLHLLLIVALVWLPVVDLSAGMASSVEPFSVELKKADAVIMQSHDREANHSVAHHQHQANTAQQSPSLSAEPMHVSSDDCVDHQSPCCTTCVSFCGASVVTPTSATSPRIERSLQFSDSLAVVVLARDIRPPIV